MIICPSCKEEIDDDSYYCDQCGQALLYCKNCGRVGIGRRCTYCGGLMVSPQVRDQVANPHIISAMSVSNVISQTAPPPTYAFSGQNQAMAHHRGVPTLVLYNSNLNIRIQGVNGAVIGRRQGPYTQFFEHNMYVSGVHAQLKYNSDTGWCIVDKHSSNGTKLNQHSMQPDVEMSLKNGDIVALANVNLQVIIS